MKKYKVDITTLWDKEFTNIDTPDGNQKINKIIKKLNKECTALLFSNGDIIECSTDHLIETEYGWVKSNDLEYGTKIISKDTNTTFISKKVIGIKDVYDLEIYHKNHRYWTDNISSHNTGKSSTAHAIIKEINGEALWINASMERGVDVLRGKVSKFASQSSFDDNIKIVVMDEFDHFSKDGQAAFRGFIDEFSQNCRFIFTGNYKEKIIQPLLDRLEVYDFNSFPREDMVKPIFERLKFILDNENVKYDPKSLVPIINTFYPRIRSMVGALQKFSKDGEFKVDVNELDDINVFDNVMQFVKPTTYTNMICEVNKLNAPSGLYTYLYNNASKYIKPKNYPQMVLIIAKYQHMSEGARDANLNASACLTEIMPFMK
jgi:DNA polymerase III delta prime subunit